jgi:DNA transposition AAA+ family ATPase
MYGLGINTLRDWEKLEKETGSLEKRPLDRKPGIDLDALRKYCEEFPFATHIEAGVCFNCSERVIRYAKDKLGITRKKKHHITQSETSKNELNSSKD